MIRILLAIIAVMVCVATVALCGIDRALHSLIDNGVTVSDVYQRD